jgi:hypothetical protein
VKDVTIFMQALLPITCAPNAISTNLIKKLIFFREINKTNVVPKAEE